MKRVLPHLVGIASAAVVVSLSASVSAQTTGNAVPSVGAMRDIPEAGEKPDPRALYRIVFDEQSMPDDAGEVSEALQSIGGLMNTYRRYGVPVAHLQATAVFHGRSILLVANNGVHARRTGVGANPNAALLRELATAGVQLTVCGQSA